MTQERLNQAVALAPSGLVFVLSAGSTVSRSLRRFALDPARGHNMYFAFHGLTCREGRRIQRDRELWALKVILQGEMTKVKERIA